MSQGRGGGVSLTTRLTAFFLAALAAVLLGFSTTLWLLAREYLSRQVDERLEAALQTLVASIEFDADGLEWEPNQRSSPWVDRRADSGRIVALPQGSGPDQVRWLVRDGRTGTVVDRSLNLHGAPEQVLTGSPVADTTEATQWEHERFGETPWRVARLRVAGLGAETRAGDEAGSRHGSLVLTAGLSLVSLKQTLANLARLLAGLSIAVWLVAAGLSRRLCRRALVPVTRMAEAARSMSVADLDQRLPALASGDELQDLGDAFNGLLDRLNDAFERQRRFTGDASHQLRTPLAALLGQVEVALRRERPVEDLRNVLTLVRDKATQLGQIVETLLFLARADAEAPLPDSEVIDLAPWLDEYLQRWANGNLRAADLTRSLSEGPFPARAHLPLLAQLLDNLLDNAGKYSEPGTPITIALGREPESSRVTLSVEDRGRGIDPEALPRVFEPFYRAPSARREGRAGTGLGLAVAQRIAAAMNGVVLARSEPGQGSRFTIRFADLS